MAGLSYANERVEKGKCPDDYWEIPLLLGDLPATTTPYHCFWKWRGSQGTVHHLQRNLSSSTRHLPCFTPFRSHHTNKSALYNYAQNHTHTRRACVVASPAPKSHARGEGARVCVLHAVMSLSSKQPPDLVPSPVNDISQLRWDQATFLGRLNHFSRITDPRLLLKSRRDVGAAQHLYHLAKWGELERWSERTLTLVLCTYREGHVPRGTTQSQLYHAQTLYHSAVHPDSDGIMHPMGRMSAQVPFGMVITGILLALYKYAFSITH